MQVERSVMIRRPIGKASGTLIILDSGFASRAPHTSSDIAGRLDKLDVTTCH